MAKLEFVSRPAGSRDLAFIVDSWCKSFYWQPAGDGRRQPRPPLGEMEPPTYRAMQRILIARLLPRSTVTIAANPEDYPWHIFGWACVEAQGSPILHYIFVKKDLRGAGVASGLLSNILGEQFKQETLWCSHWTGHMARLRLPWKLQFNPYVLNV